MADSRSTTLTRRPPHSSALRLGGALAMGVAAGVGGAVIGPWQMIPLLGWDGMALSWLAMMWLRIACLDADATSDLATRVDPRRASSDTLLLSASVASLIAVLLGVVKASNSHGETKAVLLAAGIATVVISWAVVHTLFALRYAALYYRDNRGVDFNEDDKPNYADFAYLAFTIGMTYQVSDTNLQSKAIRHTALRHALLSYLFGTVIIAATINLVAGLVK